MRRLTLILLACCGLPEAGKPDLKSRLDALIAPLGKDIVVEVAFHDGETGESCLIRADEPIHPASTPCSRRKPSAITAQPTSGHRMTSQPKVVVLIRAAR